MGAGARKEGSLRKGKEIKRAEMGERVNTTTGVQPREDESGLPSYCRKQLHFRFTHTNIIKTKILPPLRSCAPSSSFLFLLQL